MELPAAHSGIPPRIVYEIYGMAPPRTVPGRSSTGPTAGSASPPHLVAPGAIETHVRCLGLGVVRLSRPLKPGTDPAGITAVSGMSCVTSKWPGTSPNSEVAEPLCPYSWPRDERTRGRGHR